ncbi:hypothetical protein L596_005838 [Steinernema carpocapsae]|uniref:Uncharacterized protein n=1 Tax=Steinernema carpocapsae TaxID=34508 RepID=A0A4U8V0B6_STECR|nr:hypothetical protein L596_005838 [Steinernema carpocapsae]
MKHVTAVNDTCRNTVSFTRLLKLQRKAKGNLNKRLAHVSLLCLPLVRLHAHHHDLQLRSNILCSIFLSHLRTYALSPL